MLERRPIPKLRVALASMGVLLAVVSGSAFAQTTNLIVNGDAESGAGGDGFQVVPVPGWTTSGNFTVAKYAAVGGSFPTTTDPGPPDRGNNFFAGGTGASSSATQSIDVLINAAAIDTGNTTFDLTGYLGGFANHGDNATLSITFESATGTALGTASIGPVSAADRGNVTKLLPRGTSGNVPTGTRQIEVLLQITRTTGSYNDGYADNLSLVLTAPPNNAPSANDDPTTAGDPNYTTNEDTALTVSAANGVLANDTDAEGDTLTAMKVSDPANGTLMLDSEGSFTYTPNANFSGTDTFTYKANDGTADSNVATVTLTVNAANDPPVAVDDTATTPEDTAVVIDVKDGDTDPDGDALTVQSVTDPPKGMAQIITSGPDAGKVHYTPDANFNGTDSFQYTISDANGGEDTATVTVTVDPENDPPVADSDSYKGKEDQPLNVPASSKATPTPRAMPSPPSPSPNRVTRS